MNDFKFRPILHPKHSHGEHGHTHEHWPNAGLFHNRDAPLNRDYRKRSFTVGIGEQP